MSSCSGYHTKYCRLGGLNHRNLLSHSSSDASEFKIAVLAGLVPSEAVREGLAPGLSVACRQLSFPASSHYLPSPSTCFCVQINPFYDNSSHIGLGPTLNSVTSVKTLTPNGHILRAWQLGFQHIFLGMHDSTENALSVAGNNRLNYNKK